MRQMEGERRERLVINFAIVGLLVLGGFGLENWWAGRDLLAGLELGMAGVVAVTIFLVKKWKYVELGAVISALAVMTMLWIMLITGGIARTGAFWYFVFPVLCFYLVKRGMGITLFGINLIATIILWAMSAYPGWVTIAYSGVEVRQLLVSYLVIGILLAYYQRASEEYESELHQSNQKLSELMHDTASQQKKVDEVNLELKRNQIAMMNLLEDARELEKQLKVERDSVTVQVAERR